MWRPTWFSVGTCRGGACPRGKVGQTREARKEISTFLKRRNPRLLKAGWGGPTLGSTFAAGTAAPYVPHNHLFLGL